MKKAIIILTVILIVILGLSTFVYAEEEPDVMNQVSFETFNWWRYTPAGDIFTNSEIDGSMFLSVGFANNQFATGESIPELELFLDNDIDFNWLNQTYTQAVPVELIAEEPQFHWSIGETPVGDGAGIFVNPLNPDDVPITYEPGFDVMRWVDKTEFSQEDGTQTQTLTIMVTPRENYTYITNNIIIYIGADENTVLPTDESNLVEAAVNPLLGDNWFCTPDGHFMGVFFADWEVGKPITTKIEVEVTPNVPVVEDYMPTVWVFEVVEEYEDTVWLNPFIGDTLVMEQPPLGTWTWAMDMDYLIGGRTNVLLKGITFPNVHPEIEVFNIESMFVEFGEGSDLDEITITEASFNLSSDASYDLANEDIKVIVDGVIITIPAGSLNAIGGPSSEKYIYNSKGTEYGRIQMVVDFDEGEWSLIARDIDASLIDNSDGVTIVFAMGDSAAIEIINMQVGGLSYTAGD